MLTKPSSVSKQFIECYPMAISEYKNDAMESSEDTFHKSLDNAFQLLEVRSRNRILVDFVYFYVIISSDREAGRTHENFDENPNKTGKGRLQQQISHFSDIVPKGRGLTGFAGCP